MRENEVIDSDAAADALCEAADLLEARCEEREHSDPPTATAAATQRGQMLNDARWLRRLGVAMRLRLHS